MLGGYDNNLLVQLPSRLTATEFGFIWLVLLKLDGYYWHRYSSL